VSIGLRQALSTRHRFSTRIAIFGTQKGRERSRVVAGIRDEPVGVSPFSASGVRFKAPSEWFSTAARIATTGCLRGYTGYKKSAPQVPWIIPHAEKPFGDSVFLIIRIDSDTCEKPSETDVHRILTLGEHTSVRKRGRQVHDNLERGAKQRFSLMYWPRGLIGFQRPLTGHHLRRRTGSCATHGKARSAEDAVLPSDDIFSSLPG